MANFETTPPVQKLFSYKGNEEAFDTLAKEYPLFAYPEYNLILFKGSSVEMASVEKFLEA